MVDQCQTAIEGLERAQAAPPLMVLREADLALRAAIDVRDTLIEQLRHRDTPSATRVRAALDRVNVALSLMVALEYPTGGIQREAAKQAHTVLKSLLDGSNRSPSLCPAGAHGSLQCAQH